MKMSRIEPEQSEVPQAEGVKKTLRGGVDPQVGRDTRIKKGEVRNPEGKNGQDYITRALKEVFGDTEMTVKAIKGIMKGKSAIAKVMLLEKAAERLEGKVAQPVRVTGELTVNLADEIRKARERAESE